MIATGQTTEVWEFVRLAFAYEGIELAFAGEGVEEYGYVVACRRPEYLLPAGYKAVAVNPRFYRPTEVDLLLGNPDKTNTKLGWKPAHSLPDLVKEMVEEDLKEARKVVDLRQLGYQMHLDME